MSSQSVEFPMRCMGRNTERKEVFKGPVSIKVRVSARVGGLTLAIDVNCPYNYGCHGHKCNASQYDGARCVFALDLPHAMDIAKF